MKNLVINGDRLWGELMETGAIGATSKGGLCRLTLSEADRQVRDWFKARAEALGCEVTVDDMGVMFARRAGQQPGLAPIVIGSHLDTQPTGGKFDGVLGVLGALEALQTMVEANYQSFAPIEVVNWTNEEGSRFAPAMLSSGVFAGVFEPQWALTRTDRSGVAFGDALEAIGYRGTARCGAHPLSAYFELHIEQGPVLEAEGCDIGVVTGVQGMRWYEALFIGQDAHTGATPMRLRKNALVGAARLIERVDAMAWAHSPEAVATVGSLEVTPNSPNVVPGRTRLTVDVRHPEAAVLEAMEQQLLAAVEEVSAVLGLEGTVQKIRDQPRVRFDPECVEVVGEAAAARGFSARALVSGAGHDAAYVARVAPTAMIFVPCREGVSHNETEFSSKEQCAAGAQVLMEAVLRYDQRLAERR